jgi:hypothetical protein
LLHGLWDTRAPWSAIIAMSRASHRTQCTASRPGPSRPARASTATSRIPNLRSEFSISKSVSDTCIVTSAPSARATSRVAASVCSSTVQIMHGARPTRTRAPGRLCARISRVASASASSARSTSGRGTPSAVPVVR